MRIYRVEMGSGAGPYSPHLHGIKEWEWQVDQELDQMYADHKGDGWSPEPTHPTPYAEFRGLRDLDRVWGDWNCGFESMAQLEAWFDGWLHKLAELGFMVGIYEVPEFYARVGQCQAIFNKDNSTLVGYNHLLKKEMRVAA